MKSKKILWVDDEPRTFTAYFRPLQRRHSAIDLENHLAQTLEVAITRITQESYDLIVSDLLFPEGNLKSLPHQIPFDASDYSLRYSGLRLLETIRLSKACYSKTESNVPFIVHTAAMDRRIIEKCLFLKANQIIYKPVSFNKVIEMISSVLETTN